MCQGIRMEIKDNLHHVYPGAQTQARGNGGGVTLPALHWALKLKTSWSVTTHQVYPLTWRQTSEVLPASEPCPSGHRAALSSLLVVHSGDCATLPRCWRSC